MSTHTPGGTRPRSAMSYGLSYVIDIAVPILLYVVLTEVFGIGEFWALVIGTVAAAATTAWSTLRRGHLDGIGVLIILELVASLAFVLIVRDARILLVKPAVLIALGAGYGLLTCFRGRPLGYQYGLISTGNHPERQRAWDTAWRTVPAFRARMRATTVVWAALFLLDAAIRVWFALHADLTTAIVDPQLIEIGLIVLAFVASLVNVPYTKKLMTGLVAQERRETVGAR